MFYLFLIVLALLSVPPSHAATINGGGSGGGGYNIVAYGAVACNDVNCAGGDDTDSYAAIVAAQNAAALTCGIVDYPGGSYYVSATVIPADCVTHQGVGYSLTVDSTYALTGGTVLVGNGTSDMFAYNGTPTTCGTITEVLATLRSGVRILDLAIRNVGTGIRVGAFCNGGLLHSVISNVFIGDYAAWAFYWENGAQSYITQIVAGPGRAGSTGAMWFGCSHYHTASGAHYNFGNMFVTNLDNASPQSAFGARGIEFVSRNGASCNDWNVTHIHSLVNYTKQTQAGTFTTSSANIGVSTGSTYPVGMPVTVEGVNCLSNGFTPHRTYFVVSRVGNTIQVANFWDGAALAAGNNLSGCSVVTYGWPALFIGGSNNLSPAVSAIQSSNFSGLDVEGRATALLVLQNAAVNVEVGYINGGQGTETACGIVNRASTGVITSAFQTCLDSSFNVGLIATGMLLRNEINPNTDIIGLHMIDDGLYQKRLGGLDIVTLAGNTLASIAASSRTMFYCSNCNVATPCTSGGTGAWAFRTSGGTWTCPF